MHGLYHLGSRAPSLALICLSRVLLSTRSLFATNALQESTVRNAACANPVHEVDRERIVFLTPWLGSNPERQARIHHDTVASASCAVDMTPSIHVSDDRLEHVSASQAQILKVLELMDCEDGYESSMRRLPQIDVCRHVQYENELDAATIQRIDNVFRKGIKSNDLGKVKISVHAWCVCQAG